VPEQQQAVQDATKLAGDVRSASQSVQQLRGAADQSIAAAVTQANQDLSQLASLNQQAGPGVSPALFDQQDAALKDLAKQIGITFNRAGNGQVQVFTQNGQPLLLGQSQTQLAFNPTGVITANDAYVPPGAAPGAGQNPTLSGVLLQPPGGAPPIDITLAIKGGAIGGNLQLRDRILPQAQSQLDALAESITTSFENTGTGYAGTAVQLFTDGLPAGFPPPQLNTAPANLLGLAGRLQVNPIVQIQPWRLRDGTNPTSVPTQGAPGNTAVLNTVDSLFTSNQVFAAGTGLPGTATLGGYASSLIGFQAVQAASVQGQTSQSQSLAIAAELNAGNGVSLDQEMVDLSIEQIAYKANAKSAKTAAEMSKTLLDIKT
jgi:flagellar hook-associated protein 1 FlgK